ncbi:hypothetical protein BDW_05015 [Bdellovibrio bacteriovorus W]|nr:hypothetical protein BDW_05015 [Bdellovibrio bacteriovorus W]
MKTIITAMIAFCLLGTTAAQAKSRTVRKVQEVNFGEMNLKGTIRNPDGAYLVQKKGIKFMPLYDVQKDMDSRIRESALYLNN